MNSLTSQTPLFRRVLALIFLTVSAFLVSGCGEPDPVYLPALLADPMASYSHPDLEQEIQIATKKHTSWKGTEESADIITGFLVDENADAEAVVADILRAAEAAGWAVESMEPDVSSRPEDKWWRSSKFIAEGLVTLRVLLQPSYRTDGMEISLFIDFAEEDAPTPILSVVPGARYAHASDLRNALEAIGLRCNLFTNQEIAPMATCNEHVALGVFADRQEADAHVGQQSTEANSRVEYVVGANWVVEMDAGIELSTYVSEQLGGERLATEDQG